MQVEMTVTALDVDPTTNRPIVILRERGGQRILSICVGIVEANAIVLAIEAISTPRPMTHDLLRNVIHDLKADVQNVVVSDLKENTFYAVIHLMVGGELVAVDARPSDAIALALRVRAPIFAEDTGPRQREAAGRVAGHRGLRAAAEVARSDRPRRTGEIQDVSQQCGVTVQRRRRPLQAFNEL